MAPVGAVAQYGRVTQRCGSACRHGRRPRRMWNAVLRRYCVWPRIDGSAIVLAMNRRTFIHAASATGVSLTSRFGFGATDRAVAVLVNLLENSPRDLIPRALVRLI